MTGAGNDFVVIDNRSGRITKGPSLARKLCDRRWGIGADGLLLLERSRRGAYKMMYYNADGSYGGMCGNGGRCIASYAFKRGIAFRRHRFEALGFLYEATVDPKRQVSLRMKDPVDLRLDFVLPVRGKKIKLSYVNTGSPHVVIPIKSFGGGKLNLDDIDVESLGREIRFHREFHPDGTNVNFIEVISAKRLRIRTYERGVEAETLACGTGSVAGALIGSRLFNMKLPITIVPRSKSPLQVVFEDRDGSPANIFLKGSAETLFRGEVVV